MATICAAVSPWQGLEEAFETDETLEDIGYAGAKFAGG